MAKFRQVSPKIWNDAKFRALSDNGKLVFFMLLTHPHTSSIGTIRAYIQGLAAELGWSVEAFREAFQEALSKGMVKADERAGLIWLPNFIKYNLPQSPNVIKSWSGALDDCPECPLKNQIFQSIKSLSASLSKAFQQAFVEAFGKGMPNQEQEQEQEKEQDLSHTKDSDNTKSEPQPKLAGYERENPKNPIADPEDYPSMEFVELRDFYDRNVKPEGSHAGWIEFKKVKKASGPRGIEYFPGIHALMDDISKRLDNGFWDNGFEPGLAKYLNDRVWNQAATSRKKGGSAFQAQKTFQQIEDERELERKARLKEKLKAMQEEGDGNEL